MKKARLIPALIICAVVLTACGNTGNEGNEATPTAEATATPTVTAAPTATPAPTGIPVPDEAAYPDEILEADGITQDVTVLEAAWKDAFLGLTYAEDAAYETGASASDSLARTVNPVKEADKASGLTIVQEGDNGQLSEVSPADWLCFSGVDFGDISSDTFCVYINAKMDHPGVIGIVLDELGSEPVGYVQLSPGAAGGNREISARLNTVVTGVHDVYLVFHGEGYSIEYWYTLCESLKEVCADYFYSGVALPRSVIGNSTYFDTINNNFDSITCENEMKPDALLDGNASRNGLPETYLNPAVNFSNAMPAINYAESFGQKIRLHTLVWHSQTPSWFFTEDYTNGGELVSKEVMLQRMENYIRQVLEFFNTEYPELVYAVDVVNEAFVGNDGDENGVRNKDNLWYDVVGPDYVYYAFVYARKYANENMKLFYNDYSCMYKQEQIVTNLKRAQDEGLIDGIGMQGHLSISDNAERFVNTAKYFCDNGFEVQITELDIGMDAKTDANLKVQNALYQNVYRGLVELTEQGLPVTSVTVWGLTDSLTWRAGKYPLLFNTDLSPKSCYYSILKAFR